MELTQSQNDALDRLVSAAARGKRIIALSGAAGTGKTTMINELRTQFNDVVVCTPTNKAAQVLCNKGIPATTFFKTFYLLVEGEQRRNIKPRFVSCKNMVEEGYFPLGIAPLEDVGKLPEGKRAFANVIIVDEASMVTSRMVAEMRSMCNHLILVGDRHQLPPVGDRDNPAGYFASLQPDAELTEVLRQAEGSLILTLANELRLGSTQAARMLRDFAPQDDFEAWVKREARAIAYTNKERRRINHICRQIFGYDQPFPQLGDRVIGTNNYSDDFLNGTEAVVLDFEWDGRSQLATVSLDTGETNLHNVPMLMASFIDDQIGSQQAMLCEDWEKDPQFEPEKPPVELTFGYCLTAHKSQGSEWADVAVFDQLSLMLKITGNDANAAMAPEEQVRRWTYTAITRARRNLAFAPTWWAKA